MRDTDPSDRWHSRATKVPPPLRRRDSDDDDQDGSSGFSGARPGAPNPNLYRFSDSPNPSMRYQQFPSGQTSPGYDSDHAPPYSNERRPAQPYSPTYGRYQNAAGAYPSPDDGSGPYAAHHSHSRSHSGSECACRAHHSHAVAALANQLHHTLGTLRAYPEHRTRPRQPMRRVQGLNEFIQGPSSPDSVGPPSSSYGPGALPTPVSDSELNVPSNTMSSSSTPYSNTPPSAPHSGGSHHPQQDWNSIAAAGFNPYFPVGPQDSEMYR